MQPCDFTAAIRAELELKGPIGIGKSGMAARRVQEWLSFHGFRTTIDADFGTATAEGNTNDEGSSDGYEVCSRIRSAAAKDFILLPA